MVPSTKKGGIYIDKIARERERERVVVTQGERERERDFFFL